MESLDHLKPGDTWRCLYTGISCTIMKVRYFPKLNDYGVRYLRQYAKGPHIKTVKLFTSSYKPANYVAKNI